MKQLCIFLADGFEEIEALTVVDIMRRSGKTSITMVSITGSAAVTGAHGIEVKADALFDEMYFGSTDAIVLPGGMPGTLSLKAHSGLQALMREFDRKEKLIAAICAAPSIPGEAGLLEGREATCYPGMEQTLLGAKPLTGARVVCDGHFITSRGMGTAMEFSIEILRALTDNGTAQKVKNSVVY